MISFLVESHDCCIREGLEAVTRDFVFKRRMSCLRGGQVLDDDDGGTNLADGGTGDNCGD